MPAVNIAGYQGFGGNVGLYPEVLNIQGQVNVTHVKGAHTLRVGSDNRRHGRKISNLGNTSGVVNYTNLYTRAADDTTVFPAGNLGLSWAAFMLGVPQSFSIDDFVAPELHSSYFSAYGQDTWRASRNLTLNFGLRYEYESGIVETGRRDIIGWDPDAVTAITRAGRSGLRGEPESEPPGEHVQGSRRADFRQRFTNERTLLEGGVAVDAASVGRLPARQPDGAQGRLRHVLRHPERGQLHAAHDRLQRHDHARDEQRLRPDLGAREPRPRDPAADRSVPAARRRHALRPDRWRQPRRRLVARQCRDDRQPGSQAPARAAVSGERPARAVGHDGHRGRLQLPGRRSAADDTPHGLPAGGVLEREQRQGRHAAEFPADERAQPLPALELLLAPGDRPRPLRADGGQRLLHEHHRAVAASPPRSVPAVFVGQLREPAARQTDDARRGGQLHAPVQQGLRPERGLLGQPDPQSGVPERVRPRADALAAERQRPPAPHHRQRPGRDSVRPGPEVREHAAFLARFSAAGRSPARSNTSPDRSSRGATSSSTAISTTSRATTRRSSAGSTSTPGSNAIRRRGLPTSRSASSRSGSMASGGRT